MPLLQIAPSKTDAERLLVVSPELADVLSAIITRIRGNGPAVPLVAAYDDHERLWLPPAPVLFQRRIGAENRAIPAATIRKLLAAALARTGLTDPDGAPLHYTLHDFRRMFLTDAIMNGLPPHIAQVIAGHRDINVTLGYKAVYPDEAIQAHLAFLARRRALRPSEEYRTPTDDEWDEFLGHFERRKVATGTCGRAFGTPCIHEHSCLRCAMHWPDPAQRARIAEIRDNLTARIAEAEREGWLGEVEGLKISLAGAEDKLAQIDRRSRHPPPPTSACPHPPGKPEHQPAVRFESNSARSPPPGRCSTRRRRCQQRTPHWQSQASAHSSATFPPRPGEATLGPNCALAAKHNSASAYLSLLMLSQPGEYGRPRAARQLPVDQLARVADLGVADRRTVRTAGSGATPGTAEETAPAELIATLASTRSPTPRGS